MSVPLLTMGRIAMRSLRQHRLSTSVTILSAALAAGLVMSVFSIASQSSKAFQGGALGFDGVLGARGSATQLVLNSVFHLDTSPGNLPYTFYTEIASDPNVAAAYPYVVGDNFRGFRIVGTVPELLTEHSVNGELVFDLPGNGVVFDPEKRQAVIGSVVAMETGLTRGKFFHPTHTLDEHEGHEHDEDYVVTGVLAPTNSPVDRVIWVPLEGTYRLDGHYLRGSGEKYEPQPGVPIPDEHKEVSAVMIKLQSPESGRGLFSKYNQDGKLATFAWPIVAEVQKLFMRLGWVSKVLLMVAYLVVMVAAGSLLASLYNTMNERRREFAILRSLGARRGTLLGVILMESTLIALAGAALGYLFYWGIGNVAASLIRQETGVVLQTFAYHPALWWTPLGMLVVGAIAGLIPAWKAYSTDVSRELSQSSA